MGSSYLGDDERGEYCTTCYGRPDDVSKETHDRVVTALETLLAFHGGLQGACYYDEINGTCRNHLMFLPCPVTQAREALLPKRASAKETR